LIKPFKKPKVMCPVSWIYGMNKKKIPIKTTKNKINIPEKYNDLDNFILFISVLPNETLFF
jgi:hypothetical protein